MIISPARSGQAWSRQFLAAVTRTRVAGPVLSLLLAAIVVLMVAKPGG